MPQEQHVTGEHLPAQGPVPHPVPEPEHALCAEDQFIADFPRFPAALGDLREVAQQVRPAQLPAGRLHPCIGAVASVGCASRTIEIPFRITDLR